MRVHVIADGACRHGAVRAWRGRAQMRRSSQLVLALLAVALVGAPPAETRGLELAPVTVKGESLRAGGERFVSYGFNYGFGDDQGTLPYFDRPSKPGLREIRGDFA